MESINKIHRRQLARFLDHLEHTNQLTPSLENDIKRAFGFIFLDVNDAIKQELDTEMNDGELSED